MSWRLWSAGAAALALAGAGAVAAVANPSGAPPAEADAAAMRSSRIRDLDIAFYQARADRDPRSARDFTELAGLYLQRARETADNEDLVRAESTARHSLELRTGRNDAAYGVLATSLMGQHRFSEALDVSRTLLDADSTSTAARGLVAEAALELGRYAEAGTEFGRLASYQAELGVAPRLARWAELRGRPKEARRLLRQARDLAARRHGMPREQIAWLNLRLGDLALRAGHLDEAERELEAGLAILPRDHRLLGTVARLYAVRHEWKRAIDAGELAVSRALDPATLGLLHDAWAAQGDSGRAAEYAHAMAVAVLRQPGAYHRAWSLFLLDHDREVDRVLANAEEELRSRQDVYGYDLVAWALHKTGRDREALWFMNQALTLGTQDAMLYFHAGMIERALGADSAARARLDTALEINPQWHPFQPAAARAVLDSLSR